MRLQFRLRSAIRAAVVAGTWAASSAWGLGASVQVSVNVNIVPSSGACFASGDSSALNVSCSTLGSAQTTGLFVPNFSGPESRPLQNVGVIENSSRFGDDSAGATPGPQIAGWRTISHDNGRYVELTLAW